MLLGVAGYLFYIMVSSFLILFLYFFPKVIYNTNIIIENTMIRLLTIDSQAQLAGGLGRQMKYLFSWIIFQVVYSLLRGCN